MRSPELRHEVPVPIPDPFLYAEKGDRRIVILHSLELPRVREDAPELEIVPLEELGSDELFTQGLRGWEVTLELAVRACRHLGIERAIAPKTFPVGHADHLRANGVELVVDRDLFYDRRRSKNETELRGIRNAQRACEAALDASRGLLRRAQPNGAGLEGDGEALTCGRLERVLEGGLPDPQGEGGGKIGVHGPPTAVRP